MALTAWPNIARKLKDEVLNVALYLKGVGEDQNYAIEVDPASGGIPVTPTPSAGRTYADSVYFSYLSTPVDTSTWQELIASTAETINEIFVYDTGGKIMELGVGAVGFETRIFLVSYGGPSSPVDILIAAGSRLCVRGITGTASTGDITITGLK